MRIRSTVGGTSSSHVAGTAYTWLRIVRSGTNGETFTTFGKVNSGDSWTQISTTTITGLTGKVHIGLQSYDGARKAFKDQTLTVGTLDNVSIVLGTGGVLNPDLATNALTIPTITVGTVTHNSVAITWNNVSGDNGYIVERSSDRINWTQISGALGSSTFSFTDSTVNEAADVLLPRSCEDRNDHAGLLRSCFWRESTGYFDHNKGGTGYGYKNDRSF